MEIDINRFRLTTDDLEAVSQSFSMAHLMGLDNEGDGWMSATNPNHGQLGLGLKALIGLIGDEVGRVEKIPASVFMARLQTLGFEPSEIAKVRTTNTTIDTKAKVERPDG